MAFEYTRHNGEGSYTMGGGEVTPEEKRRSLSARLRNLTSGDRPTKLSEEQSQAIKDISMESEVAPTITLQRIGLFFKKAFVGAGEAYLKTSIRANTGKSVAELEEATEHSDPALVRSRNFVSAQFEHLDKLRKYKETLTAKATQELPQLRELEARELIAKIEKLDKLATQEEGLRQNIYRRALTNGILTSPKATDQLQMLLSRTGRRLEITGGVKSPDGLTWATIPVLSTDVEQTIHPQDLIEFFELFYSKSTHKSVTSINLLLATTNRDTREAASVERYYSNEKKCLLDSAIPASQAHHGPSVRTNTQQDWSHVREHYDVAALS